MSFAVCLFPIANGALFVQKKLGFRVGDRVKDRGLGYA